MTNPLAQDLGGVVRLLDCPGCGHPVDQDECPYPSGARTSVDGRAMHAVNCVNNECGWQARGWGADGARKAWNTRTHSAEIAGALRDAERLDWMDAHAERIGYALKLTESSTLSATAYISQHKSVRAFVDSAMQQGG